MQVTSPNEVKIYNLSAGKSLPEWLSDRQRRKLQKKDVDVRRRIELIQDFDMPGVSDCIQTTRDGLYALTTGVYTPRLRCYDFNNLSMKFERGFDAEVVKFEILSDDYSKLVFLQCDRFVEFHAAYGKYFRTRVPKFGRDLKYHYPSCDLYIVGASPEIWRLNLEQGRFLNSLVTDGPNLNCCDINPEHQLFVCGTSAGCVEAWDPRTRNRVAKLDCALTSLTQDVELKCVPSVTSLKFRDGLCLGVGTITGHILLYDIRSNRPMVVKDHMYGLPIRDLEYHPSMELVLSIDPRVLKIWHQDTGKQYTAIESRSEFNDLCTLPGTGLLFLANEDKKIQTYYIPSLGPAPKWCSFLDNITEELEEDDLPTVYDDYKFVTLKDLEELGLSHLLGSNLIRAYMHGYFIDIRLYHKAKALVNPFAFSEYRKKKIQEKMEEERKNRVKLQKQPQVNQQLAKKLSQKKKEKEGKANLLEDDRFKALFTDPDFQVDTEEDEFKSLRPAMSKLEEKDDRRKPKKALDIEDEELGASSASSSDSDESSDEDETKMKIQKARKNMRNEKIDKRRQEDAQTKLQPKFFQLRKGETFTSLSKLKDDVKVKKATLGERLNQFSETVKESGAYGNKELSFELKRPDKKATAKEAAKKHLEERKKVRRSAGILLRKPFQRR